MAVSGQYTWRETPSSIALTVPLKGCSPSRVDIFATDSIIKVNFVPYLIDITLKHTIKPDEHKARVKDGVLTIVVQKEHERVWGQLEADESEAIAERRTQSIARQQEAENQRRQKQIDRKHEDSRKAMRKQMSIDEGERQLLDDLKSEEKRQAEEDMYAALAQLHTTTKTETNAHPPSAANRLQSGEAASAVALPPSFNSARSLLDDIDEEDDASLQCSDAESNHEDDADHGESKPQATIFDDKVDSADDYETELRFMPPPRSEARPNNKHAIDFTPRLFPTPLRESKIAEEEDWMVKNRRYLKDHGVLGKHISRKNGTNIEDEDPTWLKAKGDDFYRNNDFRSAINAYSAALDIDPGHIPCLVNRSACYLQVGEAVQCVADCTKALQLISDQPPPLDMMGNPMYRPENTKQQVKVLARRAAAHCQSEEFQRAVEDFRAALSLVSVSNTVDIPVSHIEQLAQDLKTVELLSTCNAHKKAADAALSSGDVTQAAQGYTAAIECIPTHVACLSNRAACHLATGNYENCLSDCSLALDLLQQSPASQSKAGGVDLYTWMMPAPGSEKRKKWVLRTLTRKAACLVKLNRIEEAVKCYEMAVTLSPQDPNLAADLELLRSTVSKES